MTDCSAKRWYRSGTLVAEPPISLHFPFRSLAGSGGDDHDDEVDDLLDLGHLRPRENPKFKFELRTFL